MVGLLFVTASSSSTSSTTTTTTTATSLTPQIQLINSLLLHLRDWEYGESPTWDSFRLVTSTSPSSLLDLMAELADGPDTPEWREARNMGTVPPLTDSFASSLTRRGGREMEREVTVNEWVGKGVGEVEGFMLALNREHGVREEERKLKGLQPLGNDINDSDFLVLDDESVRASPRTIILAERASDEDAEEFRYLDAFNKTRLPWDEAYRMWCNLDIANISFDEICDGKVSKRKGEMWWEYTFMQPHPRADVQKRYEEDRKKLFKRREKALRELRGMGFVE